MKKVLLWLRRDLRLQDNELLRMAQEEHLGGAIVEAIFIPEALHCSSPTQSWLIEQQVNWLAPKLAKQGILLHCISCPKHQTYCEVLGNFYKSNGFQTLYYTEDALDANREIVRQLRLFAAEGEQRSLLGNHFFKLGTLCNEIGMPFLKFTPFLKKSLARMRQYPPEFEGIKKLIRPIATECPPLPRFCWPGPTKALDWVRIGERAIGHYLNEVLEHRLNLYDQYREFPSEAGTSQLSCYLAIGSLSVRTIYRALIEYQATDDPFFFSSSAQRWLSELLWREFFHHLISAFPHLNNGVPFQSWAQHLEWDRDLANFEAWCRGETGFPLIDAAMRQLNTMAWMHNRLRMLTASFLSKNLNQDWRLGERYFLEHLVDADAASNNGGWQWASSIGVDVCPYFRMFNPILQQEKFDASGTFIYSQLPELKKIPLEGLGSPYEWAQKQQIPLAYPAQKIDLKSSRTHALQRYQAAKKR